MFSPKGYPVGKEALTKNGRNAFFFFAIVNILHTIYPGPWFAHRVAHFQALMYLTQSRGEVQSSPSQKALKREKKKVHTPVSFVG